MTKKALKSPLMSKKHTGFEKHLNQFSCIIYGFERRDKEDNLHEQSCRDGLGREPEIVVREEKISTHTSLDSLSQKDIFLEGYGEKWLLCIIGRNYIAASSYGARVKFLNKI